MVRKISAVLAGMAVVGVVVLVLQYIGSTFHPLPEGLDPFDEREAEALAEHMAAMPVVSWVLAFSSEILGAFLGAVTAGWIARDRPRIFAALIIGVSTLGSLSNWMSFEHPSWFMVGQLVLYPVALMAAWTILERRQPDTTAGRPS